MSAAQSVTATFTGPVQPTVSTSATVNVQSPTSVQIFQNSYVCTGTCGSVTVEGTCYSSTNANPTLTSSNTTCTSDGATSPWNSLLINLTANTAYYYQAYATNSSGTGYGGVDFFQFSGNPEAPAYVIFVGENREPSTIQSGQSGGTE
jgi:hypothetical protein